jgi:hypothetical protein
MDVFSKRYQDQFSSDNTTKGTNIISAGNARESLQHDSQYDLIDDVLEIDK